MTVTKQLTCPDCGCHVVDHERFVGPHSRRCGWWDGRTTEAVAYALGLGDRAPEVRGLGPWSGASAGDLPDVPFIVFTRDHGAWEEVAGFGYPTVIDGGTVSADLFARGKVGIHVALLGDQGDQLREAQTQPDDEQPDVDQDWDLDGPAHVREEPAYGDENQPADRDRTVRVDLTPAEVAALSRLLWTVRGRRFEAGGRELASVFDRLADLESDHSAFTSPLGQKDFKVGDRVVVDGKPGVIVSFPGPFLGVRFEGKESVSRVQRGYEVALNQDNGGLTT